VKPRVIFHAPQVGAHLKVPEIAPSKFEGSKFIRLKIFLYHEKVIGM
jgi:hypothetical protein